MKLLQSLVSVWFVPLLLVKSGEYALSVTAQPVGYFERGCVYDPRLDENGNKITPRVRDKSRRDDMTPAGTCSSSRRRQDHCTDAGKVYVPELPPPIREESDALIGTAVNIWENLL